MVRFSKSVVTVGGVVLAAGLIGFTNPKTVHAVAAALVQVTNTASNPVVTQGIGQQVGQMVDVVCFTNFGNCELLSPTEGEVGGSAYVVPAGQSLVVTAVDVLPNVVCTVGGHVEFVNYSLPSGVSVQRLWAAAGEGNVVSPTTHFAYPSGLVFPPNSSLTSETGDACTARIEMTGYLTTN